IIDVGWLPAVKKGMIKLRSDITRFTRSGVVYSDGKPEDFDAVISATGFVSGLGQLIDVEGLLNIEGSPKFQSGAPTSQPGFYFMGYTESSRGHLFEARRDSQRLAKLIKQEMSREGA
ncbi:MAG TPA: hypothetical protein VFK30_10320, partial [Anaerolineae bacterium]|nr:hypothetical protein [Anaerolineae bacterium]